MRYNASMDTAKRSDKKRKRPGPKPLPKDRKHSGYVMVRVTPPEKRLLVADANAAGLSFGGYLRALWLKHRRA